MGSIDYRNMSPRRPTTPSSSNSQSLGLTSSLAQRDVNAFNPGKSAIHASISRGFQPPASSRPSRRRADRRSQSPRASRTVEHSQTRVAAHTTHAPSLPANPFAEISRHSSTRISPRLFPTPTDRDHLKVQLRLIDIELAMLGLERQRIALLLDSNEPGVTTDLHPTFLSHYIHVNTQHKRLAHVPSTTHSR